MKEKFLFDTRKDYQRVHPWSEVLAIRPEMVECDRDGVFVEVVVPDGVTKEVAMKVLGLTEEQLLRAKSPLPVEGKTVDYRANQSPKTPPAPPVGTGAPDATSQDAGEESGQDTPQSGANAAPPASGAPDGWKPPEGKQVAHYNKAELVAYAKNILGLDLDRKMKNHEMLDKIREEEDRRREVERKRVEGK